MFGHFTCLLFFDGGCLEKSTFCQSTCKIWPQNLFHCATKNNLKLLEPHYTIHSLSFLLRQQKNSQENRNAMTHSAGAVHAWTGCAASGTTGNGSTSGLTHTVTVIAVWTSARHPCDTYNTHIENSTGLMRRIC